MGGLLEQTPLTGEKASHWKPIVAGLVVVLVVVGMIALLLRTQPKSSAVPPYAANIKLSDLKMSAAENFVGASVTYLDGTVTNTGDRTIAHITARVVFKDSLGQRVQSEDVPLRVLQNTGPYVDAVDLSVSPLGQGQGKPFRLTFEHVSTDWNHEYPDIKITDVALK